RGRARAPAHRRDDAAAAHRRPDGEPARGQQRRYRAGRREQPARQDVLRRVDPEIMDASGMRAGEVLGKLDDDSPFEDEPEGEWRTLSAELLESLHPPWPGTK